MVGVANCPLYEVVDYCAGSNWNKVSVHYTEQQGVHGEGFECIEVYGDTIRTIRIGYISGVRCWGLSVKGGSTIFILKSVKDWVQ